MTKQERRKTIKPPVPDAPLLSTSELAIQLSVCDETIKNMVKRKQIPFIRLSSRALRFDLAAVRAALEKG